MADRKHKCLPRLSLFSLSVQHSNINWVIGAIPPSVRDRSPSVSHSSTAETPTGLRTCAHNRTTYTEAHTHTHLRGLLWTTRDMRLTSVNNQSKWRAQWTASPADVAGLSVQKYNFTANGGHTVAVYWADKLPSNWLASAKEHLNHNQEEDKGENKPKATFIWDCNTQSNLLIEENKYSHY